MSYKSLPLILILILAFLLRIIQVGTAPKGLHADEVSFIINAQSLMKTGKDEDGRYWPFHLQSFIDPKPALYSYVQIPFLAILGPSTFSSRIPSVLLGVLSVFLSFVLIKIVIDQKVALISAGLMAISPWHILNSRATQEVILSFVFVLISLIALAKLLQTQKLKSLRQTRWWLMLGVSTFLAMDSYHSAKVFICLFEFPKVGLPLSKIK